MTRFTLSHIENLSSSGKIRGYKVIGQVSGDKPVKPSRNRNVWKIVDGIRFQSIKEANRYELLKMLEDNGHITDLKRQVCFEINPGGTHSLKYYADFCYFDRGVYNVEDVKPWDKKTGQFLLSQLFKKKMKLMEKIHGVKIKIV